MGLERHPLSLVRIIEELLGRNNRSSSLENQDEWPKGSAALTTQHPLPTKGGTSFASRSGQSVGIVRLRNDIQRVM
jgi:hypothetical protein